MTKQIPDVTIQNVSLFSGNAGFNNGKATARRRYIPVITLRTSRTKGSRMSSPAPDNA